MSRATEQLRSDRRAWFGVGVIALLALLAVAAPAFARHDPLAVDLIDSLQSPSWSHWMGTDIQGRDVWARLLFGARVSLSVGVVSQGIALLFGVALGLIAGYYGKWIDELIMRLADVTLAFPTLLLLIALVAALQPSLGVVFITIGLVGWAGMARLVRGQVLVVRELEFVQAERALGAGDVRILIHHILPSVIAPVVIAGTLGVAGAIMAESSLSFLGLGVQPPTPSWGSMIADGRDLYQLRHAPWTSVFPGLAIGAAVLGFNLLGDALRDALDPRMSESACPGRRMPVRRKPPPRRFRRELRRRGASPQSEFPWAAARETIFLNHASTGPLPQRTVDALAEWGWLRANPARLSHDRQFDTLQRSRELVAALIGADASEIALATNTTFGLNLAAFSLPIAPGEVVITPDLEFPANVYPWAQLAERRGVVYRRVPCADGVLDPDRLARELEDERVRVVSVSWVQFASGARVDLDALGRLCRERGVYFVVDAIQGVGPITLDVGSTPIDILACGAQKWLLSPWGSGFVYVRRGLIERLEPHDVSWMAVKGSDDFSRLTDYDLTWRADARRFEFITLPFQDFAGMNASLELFAALGHADIAAHVSGLADRIVEWTGSRDDVTLVTPAARSRRGGIVSVRPRDPRAASERLTKARVSHSLREGAIRLSPHCYNTLDEMRRSAGRFSLARPALRRVRSFARLCARGRSGRRADRRRRGAGVLLPFVGR